MNTVLNIFSSFHSFHYSKALFTKIKSKFGLAAYVRSGTQKLQNQISLTLRKYFALPLLKPSHIRNEVMNLEVEMKKLASYCPPDIAKRMNRFHNYFVNYWMRLIGCETISVAGCEHKTNNVIERFNGKLAAELPIHPTLFRFIACLNTSVITDGVAIAAQAEAGNLKLKPVDKARKCLLDKAEEVERQYFAGEIGSKEVLLRGASHFNEEKVLKYLNAVSITDELDHLADSSATPAQVQDDGLPNIEPEPELDDRQEVLNDDEDLADVDNDVWITTLWPSSTAG